ncbi:MAG: hypothetical protein LQ337_002451 [Flavoplaca oasis]|nr:MAG: hypothetical protein LQ337_002451 [Flavoplaca oasis]
MSPSNFFEPDYVEESAAESDYDFDAKSRSEDGHSQKSIEEIVPDVTDKPSNDLRDEDYSTYNELLREARDFYGEEKPPFASITTGKIQASRSAVLATASGERPTTITPDLLLTLTRREWSPHYWFWTADYKGQRFIVKAVNGISIKSRAFESDDSKAWTTYRQGYLQYPALRVTPKARG